MDMVAERLERMLATCKAQGDDCSQCPYDERYTIEAETKRILTDETIGTKKIGNDRACSLILAMMEQVQTDIDGEDEDTIEGECTIISVDAQYALPMPRKSENSQNCISMTGGGATQ